MVEMKTGTVLSGFVGLRRSVAIAAVAALLGTTAPAFAQVFAPNAPPPPRREVVPRPPGPRMGWQAGHWRWNGRAWVWVGGHYARLPRPGVRWIPGHCERRPRGWTCVEGHWG
ncbi:MAG TPA: hypothetical protein VJ770_12860 [Stellaceae bacterium]|nr:hypothetical protein [Stellaceae bacterium]